MTRDAHGPIRLVAGVDLSYTRLAQGEYATGVIVLLDYPSLTPIEVRVGYAKPPIPYIPGLLAFREAPAAYAAYTRLEHKPDLLVVDGHGRSHPRRAGIATHLGVALDTPSIGVAKKRLTGEPCPYNNLPALCISGEPVAILHRVSQKRSIYVSVGHRVSLQTAYTLVKRMIRHRRSLPEPTYIADRLTKLAKKQQECQPPNPRLEACEAVLLEEARRLAR